MSVGEFELIKRYFQTIPGERKDVKLGIGDDAAVLEVPPGQRLVVTVDTLVEDIHFLAGTAPEDLAHKVLAVNLSDLAAMGAEPAWVTLSLTIPEVNTDWLEAFSSTFARLCRFYDIQLVGGDTVRGALSISIQAMGFIPMETEVRRSGAQPGDYIYVTGSLGDAGAGLELLKQRPDTITESQAQLIKRQLQPTPRLDIGIQLRALANAMIDISDGFAQDLKHILTASDVGAVIEVAKLPLSDALKANFSLKQAQSFAMTSGDDYELCFTVSADNQTMLERRLSTASCRITPVGRITTGKGLQLRNNDQAEDVQLQGYEHFPSQDAELVS